jgi:hypothetical protein
LIRSLTYAIRQASTIVSPVPLRFDQTQQLNKDIQLNEPGRETPLPQYEKTQSVPFTLNLQEDARNPGQFQLVVNIGSKPQVPNGVLPNLAPPFLNSATRDGSKANSDNSTLYQTQKSSPPTSPLVDKQGWSDLDHVPSEFLQKVVPDWNVSFSRSDSTASTQSKRLADIKARIKKKGKDYVVRLLKSSSTESTEIVEVDLGRKQITGSATESYELDSASLPAELYSPPSTVQPSSNSVLGRPDVYEIGTSNEEGVQRPQHITVSMPFLTSSPSLRHLASDNMARTSIAEDGFSDAETLIPDARPSDSHLDGDQTDFEPFLTDSFPTRSASVLSIVKTPTRGLSLVGPVRRVEKRNRPRAKSRTANSELKRSNAPKSVKPRVEPPPTVSVKPFAEFVVETSTLRERIRPTSRNSVTYDLTPQDYSTWQHPVRQTSAAKPLHLRHISAEELQVPSISKAKLRLHTNISRPQSANTSPTTQRKRSPRVHKLVLSSPSSVDEEDADTQHSPEWEEVDHSYQLREALGKAFSSIVPAIDNIHEANEEHTVPRIVEPVESGFLGEIPMPSEVELRSAPTGVRNPALMYWGLALSALSENAYEGFKLLRDTLGTEPPVPKGHVRVRWNCVSAGSLM